jgi:crossover junction endodeoxyribonuclease RuvC
MRVLGIDPGYDRMGIAVVEGKRERPDLVFSTCVETSKKQDFSERLFMVIEALRDVIATHKPDAVAVEEIFFSKNQKTAMLVAHVRGAILYLARSLAIPIAEYNPSAIKIAVTGEGRAEKRQVIDMTKKLIKIDAKDLLDDEYDAIAVAITHLVSHKISPR